MSALEQDDIQNLGESSPVPSPQPDEDMVSKLIDVLFHSKDSNEVTSAIYGLETVKHLCLVDALAYVALKSGHSGTVRRRALRALGHTGGARATRPLLIALTMPNFADTAAGALGELGSPEAVDFLVPMLGPFGNEGAPEAAARALGKIATEDAIEALVGHIADANESMAETVAKALSEGSPSAATRLIPLLEHADVKVKERVMGVLAALKQPVTIPALVSIVDSQQTPDELRSRAVETVGLIGGNQAVEALLALAQQHLDDLLVLCTAVTALGNLGDPRVAMPLVKILGDVPVFCKGARLLGATCIALSRIGDRAVVEPLIRMLEDPISDTSSKKLLAAVLLFLNDARSDYHLFRYFRDNIDALAGATKALDGCGVEYMPSDQLKCEKGLRGLLSRVAARHEEDRHSGPKGGRATG